MEERRGQGVVVSFDGFPKEGLKFLAQLEKNNNREWFAANRAGYDDGLLEPGMEFVMAIGPKLRKIAPDIHAEAKVNGSIFRIHRDTRFSKDKTPYKTHFDMWFWQGASKNNPGLWMRLAPKEMVVGAGAHYFDKPVLARYREAVDDDARGKAVQKAIARVRAAGPYEIWGSHYKRVPSPYPQDHPRAELLKHAGLYAGITLNLPPEVHTSKLPDLVAGHFKALKPLQDWVVGLF
jgi:uncharacterized protein (TIGR02453 family)